MSPGSRGFSRRDLLRAGAVGATGAGLLALSACTPDPVDTQAAAAGGGVEAAERFDLSPEQPDRVRTVRDDAAAQLVPSEVSADGVLRVGAMPTSAPLSFIATDQQTVIGSEVDLASLIADKLGLRLEVETTTFENWPLRVQTGQMETVMMNVGLTAERAELYDLASYRSAYMGFEAREGSGLRVEGPEDLSGRRVSVGPGTNQDRILNEWNDQLIEKGIAPAEVSYYMTDPEAILTLVAGRTDIHLGPYPNAKFRVASGAQTEIIGRISAGWPNRTLVAAPARKGTGMAAALQAALQSAMDDGTYARALERWDLADEGLSTSGLVTDAADLERVLQAA